MTAGRSKNRVERVRDVSFSYAWVFPALLALATVAAVLIVGGSLDYGRDAAGEALSGRFTWAIAAMLFAVFFVFTLVACHIVIFKCGNARHAFVAALAVDVAGVIGTIASVTWFADDYFGPAAMKGYLGATAFCVGYVRQLTAAFDGLVLWSAVLVVTTSCLIIANEVENDEELSRQFRGSKILMYCAAALLIGGVSEVGALHKWPAHETAPAPMCAAQYQSLFLDNPTTRKELIDSSAVAISTTVGTIASLVLAAAYLPLGIVLRQRAYRIVRPWERTETWLAIHGFALQPTQQLAKVFLILSPLLAGGPVSYLITLLSDHG